MRHTASFLFPALVVISLGLHFWILQTGWPRIAPPRESLPAQTTEVFLLEPHPAPSEPKPPEDLAPEPIREAPPEPEPEETRAPEPIREVAAEAPQAPQAPQKAFSQPRPASPTSRVPASPTAHIPTPVVLNNPPPAYPELARQKGWEGRVIVRVEVTPEGLAAKVSIARSSGFGVLDQAALRAVKKWRFQPRTVAGQPAPGIVEVPVNFGLDR